MSQTLRTNELVGCLPGLQRYALSLTRNREQAEDLVQDTVERALTKSHLFDGANLRAWLTTICRRVFLNGVRRVKIQGEFVTLDDAPPQRLGVEAHQHARLDMIEVAASFDRLATGDQLMLSLIALEGKRYSEAAEFLGIPVGTVRSRLSRARVKLAAGVEVGAPAAALPIPPAPVIAVPNPVAGGGRFRAGLR